MSLIATTIALGVMLFAATNIDDLFVLLGFFSDPRFRARNVIVGQCCGLALIVLVSLLSAFIARAILASYIGLLGLVPIAIGAKRLLDLARGREPESEDLVRRRESRAPHQTFTVAALTVANSGDNVAIYAPLFAVHRGVETIAFVAIFAVMTALWCALAHWLVHHPIIGVPIRRFGHRLLPIVLVGLGVSIMSSAGTLQVLSHWVTSLASSWH